MQYFFFAILMIGFIFAGIWLARILTHDFLFHGAKNRILVLPLEGEVSDIEFTVHNLLLKTCWEEFMVSGIVLLNLGAGEETLSICQKLCNDSEFLTLLVPSELENYFALLNSQK